MFEWVSWEHEKEKQSPWFMLKKGHFSASLHRYFSDSQFAKMPLIMVCSHARGFSLSSLKIFTTLLWLQKAGITCWVPLQRQIVILDSINNFFSLKEQQQQKNIPEDYGEHKKIK